MAGGERIPFAPDARLLVTVPDAARRLSISRATCYHLIQRGELLAISIGAARRVPVGALEAFVQARTDAVRTLGA